MTVGLENPYEITFNPKISWRKLKSLYHDNFTCMYLDNRK